MFVFSPYGNDYRTCLTDVKNIRYTVVYMTKPQLSDKLLWVDLEMTGLDPTKDRILEVAAIVTDWQLDEFAAFETVIHQPDSILDLMDEWCTTQHGASGLTDRVKTSQVSEQAAEEQLIAFAKEHCGDDAKLLLCGNSIHMDRRFIEQQWKAFDSLLHYRMLDVSAWKVVFEGRYKKKFAKPEEHRALEDIRGSIMELKYYLGKVRP
jgi:oligoribonuclease